MEPDGIDFDARQIVLQDRGMPDAGWHSTSLLNVLSMACSRSPWHVSGVSLWGSGFKRHIAVTSAAARLYERGFDVDFIVRRGLGPSLLGAIVNAAAQAAADIARKEDEHIPESARVLGTRLLACTPDLVPANRTKFLLDGVRSDDYEPFVGRVAEWIMQEPRIAEVLCWKFPDDDAWDRLGRCAISAHPNATWVLDRFLVTYWTNGQPSHCMRNTAGVRIAAFLHCLVT